MSKAEYHIQVVSHLEVPVNQIKYIHELNHYLGTSH